MSYLDKVDGWCEALHEIYARSVEFIPPAQQYVNRIETLRNNIIPLRKLSATSHPLLSQPNLLDFEQIAHNSIPHTKESLNKNSGILHYEHWKKLILQYAQDNLRHLANHIEL
ncbi:MAG: hypothetical protein M3P33_01920 [bacterium]|nr:hypothetical protein [bacterium]